MKRIRQWQRLTTLNPKKVEIPAIVKRSEMRFLRSTEFPLERDLYQIAVALFETEKLAKDGEQSIRCVIPVSFAGYIDLDLTFIEDLLTDVFTSIYPIDVSFEFQIADTRILKRHADIEMGNAEAVVLFSGGIDSLAAILAATKRINALHGLFIAHSDQSGTINIVRELERDVLDERGIRLQVITAPPVGSSGYSQLRGLLYVVCGILYSHSVKANTLVIGECGPTMYQPQFGPFDTVTMTSHPIVLKAGSSIAKNLPNGNLRLVTPFENMTKAETVATIEEKNLVPNTHSCVSQRFRDHDGTCYGCVIRQLATILGDYPDVEYRKSILGDPTARIDNLISLMRFSYDVLVDPQNIPPYSATLIEEYGKEDLAHRFALDVFAGIHIARANGLQLSPLISRSLDVMLSREIEREIPDRIQEVREAVREPSFEHVV